jgi:HlyD family secretion protein
MDLPRPNAARERRRRRLLFSSVSLVAMALITLSLARLKPAAPSVEKSGVWVDTVKRGAMLREVRGNGTLVPEEIRWIPAQTSGRVDRILVLPGAQVAADTVLLELSNPEIEQAAFDAEWALKAIEADAANLKVQLESQRLNQLAASATAEANFHNAQLEAEVNTALARDGLVPRLVLRQSEARAEEYRKVNEVERERLKISAEAIEAQMAAQRAKVEQHRAQLQLRRKQLDSLKVRAGLDGVLQKLGDLSQLQAGQQLALGANLARVANPARLKAEIRIAETQAKDVQLGQRVTIDTRNGVVEGRVARIDPAVQNGTVTVDVSLSSPLPKGARPDLSVDGTIELERLDDVLFVGRPVNGQPESSVGLFKLTDAGRGAARVPVKLGRSSVSTIEILEGLNVGDQVILSDMSAYDAHSRVRLD